MRKRLRKKAIERFRVVATDDDRLQLATMAMVKTYLAGKPAPDWAVDEIIEAERRIYDGIKPLKFDVEHSQDNPTRMDIKITADGMVTRCFERAMS